MDDFGHDNKSKNTIIWTFLSQNNQFLVKKWKNLKLCGGAAFRPCFLRLFSLTFSLFSDCQNI
jgi:hypothetical protein